MEYFSLVRESRPLSALHNFRDEEEQRMDKVYLVVVHDTVHVLNPINVHRSVKEDPLFIGGILCQKRVGALQ